jgi:hypothetical protein
VGTAVALLGFAGAAHASATIDLIWASTGTAETSEVNTSSAITLQVILTAGANGSQGAVVGVDYSGALSTLSVLEFASTPGGPLPLDLTATYDTGSRIEDINAGSIPPILGAGLSAGQSHQLGTVTFHKSFSTIGVFEIRSDADSPTGAVLDLVGNDIIATTTFKSAYLVNASVDPPMCDLVIEVNSLRAGSPTVSVGTTRKVTAKARIAKGTAAKGTTIDTTLQITAKDGLQFIHSQQSESILLRVGKGGKGDTLPMNISQCDSGSITFEATFFGLDGEGDLCEGTRRITKTCE